MLKNIRLHLQQDEAQQKHQEQQLAEHIARTSHNNINAFQRHIPSLLTYVKQQSQNISVFCNKDGDYNLVDYGTGRTFYGLHPQQEIQAHLQNFTARAPYIAFDSDSIQTPESPDIAAINQLAELPEYQRYQSASLLPQSPELVVVFGMGLGFHIQELIETYQISHLLIYEPEPQYFKASTMLVDWQHILQLAKDKGTALYLQIEKDGRDFVNNIKELRENVEVGGAYLYQHYNHPIFDALYQQLTTQPWSKLLEKGLSFRFRQGADEYCPAWTAAARPTEWKDVDTGSEHFKQNLRAFKRYFPDVYKEFKEYQPRRWLPVQQDNGEINIVDKHRLVPWYGEYPAEESRVNIQGFSEHPHKDGLVLGYNGTKLKHYLHYQFVEKTEAVLEQLEEEQGSLPETIKSMILFGMGCGYQVEQLFEQHQVEKLFICEPNRDFFYASLFAIDWAAILKMVDESDGRLYLNIGDDGTNLFRDLLNQFYAIGPYMLNSTYFYQGYYNGALNQAIAQLREQLQVVISMGEYFDHAYYGIAHTKEALRREYPFMKKNAAKQIAAEHQEIPVFLVGNGPSLDFSIDAIKEWQDKAIIVSCGTSLQVLHRNGIVPDFHAEIEQNRSTFDWAARVGDFDYLKQVTLISCNGIHPDTCDLYKDVYLAFKEGESSTVSTLQVLGEEHYQILKFAFPTVTNFAMNFIAALGMKQVYLLGVDLGFADKTHHHSKESGYYKEDGEEIYDYSEKNNTAIVVPGNFRKTVYTKHEFKVAKMLLEQSLAASKMDCYNCADGAQVRGSTALEVDSILIVSTAERKKTCIASLKDSAFLSELSDDLDKRYSSKFSFDALQRELQVFTDNVASEVGGYDEAEAFIESQKKLLFLSYQQGDSLLFYFLYGTTNYANSVFSKILYSSSDSEKVIQNFNCVLKDWISTLDRVKNLCALSDMLFDTSGTLQSKRVVACLRREIRHQKLTVVTNSSRFVDAAKSYNNVKGFCLNIRFISTSQFSQEGADSHYVLFHQNSRVSNEVYDWVGANAGTLPHQHHYIFMLDKASDARCLNAIKIRFTGVYIAGDYSDKTSALQTNDIEKFLAVVWYFNHFEKYSWILPKLTVCDADRNWIPEDVLSVAGADELFYYDESLAVLLTRRPLQKQEEKLATGNRVCFVGKQYQQGLLMLKCLSVDRLVEAKTKWGEKYPVVYQEDSAYVQ